MIRHTRKIAQATLVLTVAGLLAAGAPAQAERSECRDVASLPQSKLAHCASELRDAADQAGRAAQKADERYVRAKRVMVRAKHQYDRLSDEATVAAIRAERSRTAAAAVAVQLARNGSTVDETTQVLLSGENVDRKLYHLSRMSELTQDTGDIASTAKRDSQAATELERQAAESAQAADVARLEAKRAYRDAKQESETARDLVSKIKVRQGAILTAEPVDLPADASTAQRVIAFARAQFGEPYVFGAAGPGSWDCSGLTMQAFASAGIGIGGHGATVQYLTAQSRGLLVPYSQAEPGDLVFYGGGGDYYHVAIYVGGGQMIEAPYPGQQVRQVPVRTADLTPMVARFTS